MLYCQKELTGMERSAAMNRRKFELLFGLASGAVGLAVALYTAVIATTKEEKPADPPSEEKSEELP